MRTGVANLPLHAGRAPRWLFEKMVRLGREISLAVVYEFSPSTFLLCLSDPVWFQSFGCVLGFDWHSSGVTTTVCGALKMGLKGLEKGTRIFVAGGKGKTSRKTPQEIEKFAQKFSFDAKPLIYASKISAKVDNSAIQDGYQLYHHNFFGMINGENWAVVQQGMSLKNHLARRYHWLSENVDDFVCEPHTGIISERKGKTLNLVDKKSSETRFVSSQLAGEKPERLIGYLEKIQSLNLPCEHEVRISDLKRGTLKRIFLKTYEKKPGNFEELLGIYGVGPKTIRALSLISELIYGTKPSYQDPAMFSFAHGGKDGYPYPVNRKTYEESIDILHKAIKKAKIGKREKIEAIKQLRLC